MKIFKDCQGNDLKIGDKVVYFTKYRTAYHGVIEAFIDCMVVVRYTENRAVAPFKTKLVTITTSVYSDKSLLLNN